MLPVRINFFEKTSQIYWHFIVYSVYIFVFSFSERCFDANAKHLKNIQNKLK